MYAQRSSGCARRRFRVSSSDELRQTSSRSSRPRRLSDRPCDYGIPRPRRQNLVVPSVPPRIPKTRC